MARSGEKSLKNYEIYSYTIYDTNEPIFNTYNVQQFQQLHSISATNLHDPTPSQYQDQAKPELRTAKGVDIDTWCTESPSVLLNCVALF